MAVDAGSIYSEIRIALDKLKGDISKVDATFDKLVSENKKNSKEVEENWKKSFKGISLAGTAAIAGLTLAFKSAVSTFAKTEQALANVQAVTNATAEEFELLKESAEEAGRTTRFTASESADALFFLASAGLDATQSIEALNGVLLLAGATGSDLSQAAQTVTATLSQFNLTAQESEEVVNIFAAANSNSQATLTRLQNSLRQVGPVAGSLNKSLEETVGVLQLLFNAGFEGETAGRALKSALADLASEGSVANERLSALGITFDQVNPATNDLADVFGVLADAGLNTSQVLEVFGKVAGPAVIQLISSGRDEIQKYTEAVTGTNEAARQYEVQNNTLSGSIDRFKSALESASNSLIETLAPALTTIFEAVSKVLNVFTSLPSELKALVGGFGAASVATLGFGKALTALGVASKVALGPLALVVGGITGIGIAISEATKEQREYNRINKEADQLLKDLEGDGLRLSIEYATLQKQTEKTADEQEREAEIVKELKEIYPGLTQEHLNNSQALATEEIQQKKVNLAKAEENKLIQERLRRNILEDLQKEAAFVEKELAVAWTKYAEKVSGAELSGEEFNDAVDANALAFRRLINDRKWERLNEVAKDTGTTLELLNPNFVILTEKLEETEGKIVAFDNAITDASIEVEDASVKLVKLEGDFNDLGDSAEESTGKIGDAIVDLGKTVDSELEDFNFDKPREGLDFFLNDLGELEVPELDFGLNQLPSQLLFISKITDKNAQEAEASAARIRDAQIKAIQESIDEQNRLAKEAQEENIRIQEETNKIIFEKNEEARKKEEEERKRILKEEEDRQKKLVELEEARIQAQIDLQRESEEERVKQLQDLDKQLERGLENFQKKQEERRLEEIEAEKEQAEKLIEIRERTFQNILKSAISVFGILQKIYQQDANNQIDAEKEKTNESIEQVKQRVESGVITEAKGKEEIAKLTEQSEKEIAQIKYRADLQAWEAQGIKIIADIAAGVAAALSTANFIGAAAIGLEGIAQGVLHSKSRPRPPKLQTGGVVLPESGGVTTIQAENGFPELDLNGGPEGEPFLEEFASRIGDFINEREIIVNVIIDGVAQRTVDKINDGELRLEL